MKGIFYISLYQQKTIIIMANYNNFKIQGNSGKFYLSSKEPQEGYVEVEYGTDKDKKKTYHKYFTAIEGEFVGFKMKEVEFNKIRFLNIEVTLRDGDTYNQIATPLKTAKGFITQEAKALVSSFYNAEVNHRYSVNCVLKKNTGKDGKEYNNLNIYVNSTTEMGENGKGKSTGFISFADIPRPEKQDDGLGGITYDNKNVNMFYGTKIREISSKFPELNSSSTTSEPAPEAQKTAAAAPPLKTEPKKVATPQPIEDEEEDDDLPF